MAVLKAVNLLGQTVTAQEKLKDKTDKLLHILVHPDSGKILGGVGRHGFWRIEKITAGKEKSAIEVAPFSPDEKENFTSFLPSKTFVIGAKTETESGHYLGRVKDFEFDDTSWQINKIFVSDRALFKVLTSQLQIPRDDILSMTKNKIIVRDGLVKRERAAAAHAGSEYVGVGTGATLLQKELNAKTPPPSGLINDRS